MTSGRRLGTILRRATRVTVASRYRNDRLRKLLDSQHRPRSLRAWKANRLSAPIFFSEKIIREAGTGKLSIINSFQSFYGPQFPFAAPPFVVTAAFTNLSGKLERLKVSVELVDEKNEALIEPVTGEFGSDREVTPDDVFDLSFLVPSCAFEKAGIYRVLFRIGEDILGERSLPARLIPVTPGRRRRKPTPQPRRLSPKKVAGSPAARATSGVRRASRFVQGCRLGILPRAFSLSTAARSKTTGSLNGRILSAGLRHAEIRQAIPSARCKPQHHNRK